MRGCQCEYGCEDCDPRFATPSSRPDSREHAETAKQWSEEAALALIEFGDMEADDRHGAICSALDALLAEIERLEGERDEAVQRNFDWRKEAEAQQDMRLAAEALAERRAEALRELYEYTQELQLETVGLLVSRGQTFPPVDPTLTERIETALADGGQENPA